jgi:YD repeat-containing protein
MVRKLQLSCKFTASSASAAVRTIIIVALALLPSIALAQTSSRTFYDAQGRISGTAETQGSVTTFRDGMGRMTGTAERLPDGRIQMRDAMGRMTGTSDAPR